MPTRRIAAAAALLLTAVLLAPASAPAAKATKKKKPSTREVMLVGNNWDGTADIVDARTFKRMTRLNVVPDLGERLEEIYANEVIDAKTGEVTERLDIGWTLRNSGYPGMSSAVRPMAIAPGERFFYFQVSFFHGFIEFDLEKRRPTRIAQLPIAEHVRDVPREQYLLDSAHHGLAIDGAGRKLCVAGTMSDYAAIVSRRSFAVHVASHGTKPYWSTTSADGRRCYVSYSGDDEVAVIDFKTEKEIARFPVGDHPQRIRTGRVRIVDFGR